MNTSLEALRYKEMTNIVYKPGAFFLFLSNDLHVDVSFPAIQQRSQYVSLVLHMQSVWLVFRQMEPVQVYGRGH